MDPAPAGVIERSKCCCEDGWHAVAEQAVLGAGAVFVKSAVCETVDAAGICCEFVWEVHLVGLGRVCSFGAKQDRMTWLTNVVR